MILADQHRFDARRAELNAKNGLSALNCFLGIVSIPDHLRDLRSLLQTLVNSSVSDQFCQCFKPRRSANDGGCRCRGGN
jgi:hypothetical protein